MNLRGRAQCGQIGDCIIHEVHYSSKNRLPIGVCEPLLVREIIWRDDWEDRFIWDELRDREVNDDKLPLDIKFPSDDSSGEPGTLNAVAAPLATSRVDRPFCDFEIG